MRYGVYFSIVGLVAALSSQPASAEISGYLVGTTDYVYRGVSYSDGHAALQLGGDVALDSGWYFGIWASTTDIGNGPTRQRDAQVNYYAGYSRDIGTRWSLGTSIVANTFPGTTGDIDYDYEELSVSANFNDRLWLEFAWSPDIYHTGLDTYDFEVFAEWPVPGDFNLSGGLGYYDVSALSGNGYGYWQLGISRSVGLFDLDLRFHDVNRAVPIISSPYDDGSRLAFSVRIQF